MSSVLLKGGRVLLHGPSDEVTVSQTDILIRSNSIIQIGQDLPIPDECEIISCQDKIISPGFVSTHEHMWENALKGICEDMTAVDYFATMFTAGLSLKPYHIFWSTLAGCMEAIDAGTTTALDFAHVNWTEHYGEQALAATATSGIRSVFAHAATVRAKSVESTVEMDDLLPAWFTERMVKICQSKTIQTPDYRLRIGLGFDYFHLPKEQVLDLFRTATNLGIRNFTSHWGRFNDDTSSGVPALLQEYQLLDKGFVFSHMSSATDEDLELLKSASAFISASPSSEMTLGLGPPLCFDHNRPDVDSICSVGTDCNCCASASMISELRVGLLAARGNQAAEMNRKGKVPAKVCRTSQDSFNMGTINGARALGMGEEIGSIAVGKKADLVIFDTTTPAMAIAAQHDPIRAIIMHSSPADIDTVIIDGVIRKRNGMILPVNMVEWDRGPEDLKSTSRVLDFSTVIAGVQEAQDVFLSGLENIDVDKLKHVVSALFGM